MLFLQEYSITYDKQKINFTAQATLGSFKINRKHYFDK